MGMSFLAAILILGLCILAMAVGLIFAKKVLKKGCSLNPDECECRREGKDPSKCER